MDSCISFIYLNTRSFILAGIRFSSCRAKAYNLWEILSSSLISLFLSARCEIVLLLISIRISSASAFFSGLIWSLLKRQYLTVFTALTNSLRCSRAFSLLLKDPRMVKTSGKIMAILSKVRSTLKLNSNFKARNVIAAETIRVTKVLKLIMEKYFLIP